MDGNIMGNEAESMEKQREVMENELEES